MPSSAALSTDTLQDVIGTVNSLDTFSPISASAGVNARVKEVNASRKWQCRCPLCGAFVSHNTGVCGNVRCQGQGHQVRPVRPASPFTAIDIEDAGSRFAAACSQFENATYEWDTDPIGAYHEFLARGVRLFERAKLAGTNLEPGTCNFDSQMRKHLARVAREKLATLPVKTLRIIAYSQGFRFPTLTQDPQDTGRESSLVFWLNPIYRRRTAAVVQNKALSRWQESTPEQRVTVLADEADIRLAVEKAKYASPDVGSKYASLSDYPSLTEAFTSRLPQLQPKLAVMAKSIARKYGMDADAIYTDLVSSVWECAAKAADFIYQKVSFIAQRVYWVITKTFRSEGKCIERGYTGADGLVRNGQGKRIQVQPQVLYLDDTLEMELTSVVEIAPDYGIEPTVGGSQAVWDAAEGITDPDLQRLMFRLLETPEQFVSQKSGRILVSRVADVLGCGWHKADQMVGQLAQSMSAVA